MGDNEHPQPSLFALHRIPNGLVVLLAVALLLQGPVGAFEAFWGYTVDLLGAFFGGEELFWDVLCQTAPLVLAVGTITFAFRCGWLTFSSPTSLIAASMLVLAGTWVGGELRSAVATGRSPPINSQITVRAAALRESDALLSDQNGVDAPVTRQGETISLSMAISKLTDFQPAATDPGHHQWDEQVPRVELLPEPDTLIGLVARAANQMLGYFVVYRPRLFLAAVLLGAYIGWSWQPYFQALRSWVEKNRASSALPSGSP